MGHYCLDINGYNSKSYHSISKSWSSSCSRHLCCLHAPLSRKFPQFLNFSLPCAFWRKGVQERSRQKGGGLKKPWNVRKRQNLVGTRRPEDVLDRSILDEGTSNRDGLRTSWGREKWNAFGPSYPSPFRTSRGPLKGLEKDVIWTQFLSLAVWKTSFGPPLDVHLSFKFLLSGRLWVFFCFFSWNDLTISSKYVQKMFIKCLLSFQKLTETGAFHWKEYILQHEGINQKMLCISTMKFD